MATNNNNISVGITVDSTGLNAGLDSALSRIQSTIQSMNGLNGSVGNLNSSVNALTSSMNNLNSSTHNVSNSQNTFNNASHQGVGSTTSLTGSITGLVKAYAGLAIVSESIKYITDSKQAFLEAEQAYRGLELVANNKGVGISAADELAKRLSSTSPATISEIRNAIKAILQGGGSLKNAESILSDSSDLAVFSQKGKKYGQAIVEGMEGLRMGIATNTDNMGWQENPAKAIENYAKANNILAESMDNSQKYEAYAISMHKERLDVMGALEKSMQGLAGSEAMLDKKNKEAHETVGQALVPTFRLFNEILGFLNDIIVSAIKGLQLFGASLAYVAQIQWSVIDGIKNLSFERMVSGIKNATQALTDYKDELIKAKGAEFDKDSTQTVKKQENKDKEKTLDEQFKLANELYKLHEIEAKAEEDLTKAKLNNQLNELKQHEKNKLISHKEYVDKAKIIQDGLSDATSNFYKKQIEELNKLLAVGNKQKEAGIKEDIAKANGNLNKSEEEKKGNKFKNTGGGYSGSSTKLDIPKAEADYQKTLNQNEYDLYKTLSKAKIATNEYQFKQFQKSAEDYYATLDAIRADDHKEEVKLLNDDIKLLEKRSLKPKDAVDAIKIKEDLSKLTTKLAISEENYSQANKKSTEDLRKYNEQLRIKKGLNSIELETTLKGKEVDKKDIVANNDLANHKITNQQKIENDILQNNLRFNLEKASLEKKRDLYNQGSDEYKAYQDQITVLEAEGANKRLVLEKQLNLEMKKDYLDRYDSMTTSLNGLFTSLENKPKSLKAAFNSFFDSIANNLLKIANQKVTDSIMQSDGMGSILNMLGGSSSKGSSGGSGGGFGSLVSSGMSYLSSMLPSFDVGTDFVPNDMVAQIHKGEKITPAKYNNDKDNSKQGNIGIVNNYTIQGQVDRRTQQQIAGSAAAAANDALRRNGR